MFLELLEQLYLRLKAPESSMMKAVSVSVGWGL